MTNRSKKIGTAAESAVVTYLRGNGFHGAERRALAGAFDLGDVTGLGPICVEVKAGAAAATASDGQVIDWLVETEVERQNSNSDYGLLVMRRSGYGPARVGMWWAVLPAWQFLSLAGIPRCPPVLDPAPIRLHLRDAVALLRLAGYGDTPTESENAA